MITVISICCLVRQIIAPPLSTAGRLTRTKIKQKIGYMFSKHGKSNCLIDSD